MAVFCEFISVIIRKDSIEKYYPGGWNNFAMSAGGRNMCCDGEIVRIGSMNPHDAHLDIENLKSKGLQFNQSLINSTSIREIDDVVVLDQFVGHHESRDWLEFGDTVFNERKYFSCWLKGSTIETLAFPLGYLNRMSGKRQIILGRPYCTLEEFDKRYTFVRVESDFDIYLDSENGHEFYMPTGMSQGEFYQLDEKRSKQTEANNLERKKVNEQLKKEAKAKEAARKKRREEKRLIEQKKELERERVAKKKAEDELYAKVTKIINKKTLDRTNPAVIMEMLIEQALKTDNEKDLDLIVRFWELNYSLGYFEIYDNGDTYSIFVDPVETIRLMKFEWEDYWEVDPSLLSDEERFKIFSDRIEGDIESEYDEGGSLITKRFGGCILTANHSDPREGLDYFDIGWYKHIKNNRLKDFEIIESDDNGERNFTEEELKDYFNQTYYKSDILDELLKALLSKESIESAAKNFNSSDLPAENMETDTMFSRDIGAIFDSIDSDFTVREIVDKGFEGFRDSFLPGEDEVFSIIVKRHYQYFVTADWSPWTLCSNFQLFNYEPSMYEHYKDKGIILYRYDKQHPPLNYTENELKKLFDKKYLGYELLSFQKDKKRVGFSIDDIEPEDYSDKIGQLLKEYADNPLNTMKKEKRNILSRLEKECDAQNYIFFGSTSENYLVGKVGESYVYDVPYKKTGHLRQFRNQKIRVICVGSGAHFHRRYAAGVYKPS